MKKDVASFRDIDFHKFTESLMKTMELKDCYTAGHSKRVAEIASLITRELNLSESECEYIHVAGHLHDIGKIGIPDGILLKSSTLTKAEILVMQQHPIIGASIFEHLEGFEYIASIIRYHHERFDGQGYPDMLSAENISLLAQIVSVSDAYDAMTSDRVYRRAMSKEEAIKELWKNAGTQFDPQVVEVFTGGEKG